MTTLARAKEIAGNRATVTFLPGSDAFCDDPSFGFHVTGCVDIATYCDVTDAIAAEIHRTVDVDAWRGIQYSPDGCVVWLTEVPSDCKQEAR